MIQNGAGLSVVNLETSSNDPFIGVIEAILLDGSLLHTLNHRVEVGAHQMNDREDVEVWGQCFGLSEASRNAVEHEEVDFGFKKAQDGLGMHVLTPHLNRDLVGDKFTS